MVHYGRVIKASGPIYLLSAFKFESKNRVIKTRAESTCSRKNITFTVALKEQLQLAYRSVSKRGFSPRLEFGPGSIIEDMSEVRDSCELVKVVFPSDFVSSCLKVPWVDFKGTRYQVRMAVTISYDESCGLPFFGEIDKIFCNESGNVCLLYNEYYTLGFEENFHAYQVILTGNSKCIILGDLLSPCPVICVRMSTNNDIYVTLRYAL